MTITEPNKARGPHPIRNNKQVSRESDSTLQLKRYKYEPLSLIAQLVEKDVKVALSPGRPTFTLLSSLLATLNA